MGLNDFGYTPWGKEWVRLAETLRQTRPEPHLPRARGLARDGRVNVTTRGRDIHATVHHGRKEWDVNLEVKPMPADVTADVTVMLRDQQGFTDELYRAIAQAGHPTAPIVAVATCPCSAVGPRCVHILSVYYEMSRHVDDDPRTSLSVQGCFDADSTAGTQDAENSSHVVPQRWTTVDSLDPDGYFAVPGQG